jgi:uncharacterized membrane protein
VLDILQSHMKHTASEKHSRSLLKSISYRILSLTVDSIAAYFFTRDVALSAGIVIFVNTYSTLLYYFHERVWANIPWGRKHTH